MKFKIFISSRNNDRAVINGVEGDTLTDIRRYLKRELESIKFLEKDFFDIRINEDFGATATTDSYNACLNEVRQSDFLIAFYTGASGWAPAGSDLGICHAELDTMLNISADKISIIDLQKFFPTIAGTAADKKRNELFGKYITELNKFTNPLKLSKGKETHDGFKEELLASVKNIIYGHLLERIKLSNIYFNIGGNNKISLNWKQLKYSDRNDKIKSILEKLIKDSPDFEKYACSASAIPDNMSVEDAKSFTGRPFLKDQDLITIPKKGKPKYGPIHFIGVYGNATEIQVKSLIGFPDISAIRDGFGIYVWEQNTHVQMVFLTECKTPEAVKSKFLLFNTWCRANGEYENMGKRAEARFHILKSIIEARTIAS